MIPAKAPVKNAIYREIMILGKPKNNPRRKTSLISPPPMLCFLRRSENPSEMMTKNKNVATPDVRLINEARGSTNNK